MTARTVRRPVRWLWLLALAPGLVSAQATLRQSAFGNGDGTVHVLKDATGAAMLLSGNFGGATGAGRLSSGTASLLSRSGIRLTNVLRQVQEFDDNGNGDIERATFTFEAPVSNATDATVIRIDNLPGSGIALSPDKKTVTITTATVTGTERKTTRYTAKDGVLTDSLGNPVLFWPAANRKTTLCGVADSKGDCYAQVEQDKAKPVLSFTAPKPFDTVSGTFNLTYRLSEDITGNSIAGPAQEVAFTRVRGAADATVHKADLTQLTKGNRTSPVNGGTLGLVEGAGYRVVVDLVDKADVGDPYTTANTSTGQVTNVIFTKTSGAAFVYVKEGASGTGTATNPFGTIGQAIAALPGAGGQILVLRGMYAGSFKLPSNVVLRGIGPDVTKIQGGAGCAVELDRVSNVQVTGFTIQGAQAGAADPLRNAAICVYGGTNNAIHNNILTASFNGARVDESAARLGRNTIVEDTTHGASFRYPESTARVAASFTNNVVVAKSGGTCVYFEIPRGATGTDGSFIANNALFPVNCQSASVALGSGNTFTNPNLDQNLVTSIADRGWNTGNEGVLDIPPKFGPGVVNAMSTVGLLVAALAAIVVASVVLRRKGGGPKQK
jgi:hypothetical protein